MGISVKDRKILWGRSGNRCAFYGCNIELHQVEDANTSSIIGEECHIEAQSANGPRYNASLSEKQVNSFNNLILLCANHHKIIDDNPEQYTVKDLKIMKSEHEDRVRKALEDKTDFDDMYYESIVYYIDMMLEFDHWDTWTSYLLSADGPSISVEMMDDIDKVNTFILSRVWFGTYPDLENTIKSLRDILIDFENVFIRHSDRKNNWYYTEKFYKIRPYDEEVTTQLRKEYENHMILINNLVYEITRVANKICDLTRKYICHDYRLAEGKLISYDKCPEYREGEYYPGLSQFIKISKNRDVSI